MKFNSGFSISEAEEKIAELRVKQEAVLEQGIELDKRFKSMFGKSKPAMRCIRYADRSFVLYRWRAYGQNTAPINFLGSKGQKILEEQDEEVRKTWLEFEDERQWINLQNGLLGYQIQKLTDWVDQQRKLLNVRKKFGY